MNRLVLASLVAGLVLGGCNSPEDLEPAFIPKNYAFEGTVDPKYVGTWVSIDGASTLGLNDDGTLKIETITPSPSGKSKSNVSGKWLVSNDSLLMQYGSSGKEMTVLKYSSTLSLKEMMLKQEGGRTETTYRRK
ncbi:MAG: hypothetical protein ACAH95_00675 [Fimbriimonas sp.]